MLNCILIEAFADSGILGATTADAAAAGGARTAFEGAGSQGGQIEKGVSPWVSSASTLSIRWCFRS